VGPAPSDRATLHSGRKPAFGSTGRQLERDFSNNLFLGRHPLKFDSTISIAVAVISIGNIAKFFIYNFILLRTGDVRPAVSRIIAGTVSQKKKGFWGR
jgi:hypothetical protein